MDPGEGPRGRLGSEGLDYHCRLSWWNNLSSSVFRKHDVGFYFCFVLFFFFREARSHNLRARIRGLFFGFVGILLPFVLLVNFLASSSAKGTLDNFVGKNVSEKLHVYTVRAILFSTRQCVLNALLNLVGGASTDNSLGASFVDDNFKD